MSSMSNHSHSSIRIDVSNYGPIADAKVNLKPLTVFVGPSNTGKSYLAILIYALHRFFSGVRSGMQDAGTPRSYRTPFFPQQHTFHREDRVSLQTLGSWFEDFRREVGADDRMVNLPDNIASTVRPLLATSNSWNEAMSRELARCFGREGVHWLVRHGHDGDASFNIRQGFDLPRCENPWLAYQFDLVQGAFKSDYSVADAPVLKMRRDYMTNPEWSPLLARTWLQDAALRSPNWARILLDLASCVGSTMVDPLSRPAYYLPADRTGVMHSHQVVTASMMSLAPFAGLGTNASLPNLSGVLSDFLVQLLSLGSRSSNGTAGQGAMARNDIEARMLSGTIRTDQSDAGYSIFSYKPHGWKDQIPLMNSSSMVSELAPIVLYLRHVVEAGDVLIIEEPESNLHPAMQVELVRQLAAVVNAGVRIILTTHSEWVLEALANLVHLSDVDAAKRTGSLEGEPALDRDDVGVWLFEQPPDGPGSRVTELPLDVDEGGFASEYDRVARRTYNQWVAIEQLADR